MRLHLWVLVITVSFVSEYATPANSLDLAPILEIGIRFLLVNLKRAGNITLVEDETVTIPVNIQNISSGYINLNNTQIYGFETLDIKQISASNIEPSDLSNKINLCVNLLIDKLGFTSNYDADVGIVDEIPVYGDGEIHLAISAVDFDLCLNININEDFSELYVDNLVLILLVHDEASHITRFWKNESASELVTAIINILEKFICMWMSYEKDCVSCVISPIVQFIVNSILPNNNVEKIDFNCTCLEGVFEKEQPMEDMLEMLLKSYHEGNIANMLSPTNIEHLKGAFEIIKDNVLEILTNEGLKIDV